MLQQRPEEPLGLYTDFALPYLTRYISFQEQKYVKDGHKDVISRE